MADEPSARLDGWKAIAEYLGRDLRTAQRWRKERGMPVHRVPGANGGSVFAQKNELDRWLTSAPDAGTPSRLLDEQSPAHGDSVDTLPRQPRQPAFELPPDGPAMRTVDPEALPRFGRVTEGRRPVVWATAIAGLITICGFAAIVRIVSARPSTPVTLEAAGMILTAFDNARRPLWSFNLASDLPRTSTVLAADLRHSFTIDLGGDSKPETLALINFTDATRGDRPVEDAEAYCFSSDGRLLWKYRPQFTFAFSGREFAGPWRIRAATVSATSPRRVWISFIDRTWWPSFVVSLGARGDSRLAFVNAGHIESLRILERDDTTVVLAGGYNNEYRAPVLAIFDDQRSPVMSPQTPGMEFVCERCSLEHPRRYIVFPRSEVNIAHGEPYLAVSDIETPDNARIVDVFVREPVPDVDSMLRSVYRLSSALTADSIALSDAYWAVHRRLSAVGKIPHEAENCPERRDGVVVRTWGAREGWKAVRVRPSFATRSAVSEPPQE